MATSTEGDRPEFLAFKRALEAEYRDKFLGEEKRFDEALSEIVATRRIEVEKEVTRRREAQKKKARELRESLRMELLRDLRRQLAHEVQEMMSSLDVQVFDGLRKLRGGARYEEALRRLAAEGLALVDGDALFMVAPGEGIILQTLGEGLHVEETPDLSEGSCLIIRYPQGDHIVDNSLRSRWEHLVREVSKEISHHVTPFFDQLEEVL